MDLKQNNEEALEREKINRIEKVKTELGKKDLTVNDIRVLWSKVCFGVMEEDPEKPKDMLDEKTIRKYIQRFAEMGKTLTREDFLKNGMYNIRPEAQKLFFCLLDSGLWEVGRKKTIDYRKELNQNLLISIERWLEPEDIEALQEKSAYLNVKLESGLFQEYFTEWYALNRTIFGAEVYGKYHVLKSLIKLIRNTHKSMECLIRDIEARQYRNRVLQPDMEQDLQTGNTLEEVLVSMLAERIKGIVDPKKKEDVSTRAEVEKGTVEPEEEETVNYNYSVAIMEKYRGASAEAGNKGFKDRERYEEIRNHLKEIFNRKDEWEKQLSDVFLQLFDAVGYVVKDDKICYEDIFSTENIKSRESAYLNFFANYEEVSEALEVIRSSEYKLYMQIKDSED